jgi:hypothetical protein
MGFEGWARHGDVFAMLEAFSDELDTELLKRFDDVHGPEAFDVAAGKLGVRGAA